MYKVQNNNLSSREGNTANEEDVGFRNYPSKSILEALLTIALFIPVMLVGTVIGIALFMVQGGPIFFEQKRIGAKGLPFTIYKFRTLKTENKNYGVNKNSKIPYASELAKFLRKTGLDELPQFLNILKGEMYVIGPRPLVEWDLYHVDEDKLKIRNSVKPGLTGLWQLRRKYDESDADFVELDIEYINNAGFMYDLKLFLSTFIYVLKKRGR